MMSMSESIQTVRLCLKRFLDWRICNCSDTNLLYSETFHNSKRNTERERERERVGRLCKGLLMYLLYSLPPSRLSLTSNPNFSL